MAASTFVPKFLAFAKTIPSIPQFQFPEMSFVGKSNTGKSTLINALIKKDLARSSSTPGRTQGLCFFQVKPKLIFVDFPGYGYAKVSKAAQEEWRELAEFYYQNRPLFVGTVWVFDLRRKPDALDFKMHEWLVGHQKPVFMAFTKSDTLSRSQQVSQFRLLNQAFGLEEGQGILVSGKTKAGIYELSKKIAELVG